MQIIVHKALMKQITEVTLASMKRGLNTIKEKYPDNTLLTEAAQKDITKVQEIYNAVSTQKEPHVHIETHQK